MVPGSAITQYVLCLGLRPRSLIPTPIDCDGEQVKQELLGLTKASSKVRFYGTASHCSTPNILRLCILVVPGPLLMTLTGFHCGRA